VAPLHFWPSSRILNAGNSSVRYARAAARCCIMKNVKQTAILLMSALLLVPLAGCASSKPKTDAELGLNPQQASGRQVFQSYCSSCHHAYSSAGSTGPSLKGLFRKKYLPSGLPANDRFVLQTITGGRGMMPGFGGTLDEKQIGDLLAYLHTL
jgi:mono/diheme cytochrome c family protein